MNNFDLKKYLAEGRLLKENAPGYDTRKQGEALPTLENVKAAYEAKNKIKENIDDYIVDQNSKYLTDQIEDDMMNSEFESKEDINLFIDSIIEGVNKLRDKKLKEFGGDKSDDFINPGNTIGRDKERDEEFLNIKEDSGDIEKLKAAYKELYLKYPNNAKRAGFEHKSFLDNDRYEELYFHSDWPREFRHEDEYDGMAHKYQQIIRDVEDWEGEVDKLFTKFNVPFNSHAG